MSWQNNSGRPGQRGNGGLPGSELEEMIQQGRQRLKSMIPGGGSSGGKFGFVIFILIAIAAWTAIYTVPSDSVAVIQRFGKYVKDVPSGLHFKLPFGIDVASIVPVKRQLKQEFGFSTTGATNRSQTRPDPQAQSQMVTGDLNAALVEWVVQYRIEDPRKYMFDVRNPGETLRDLSESVMREVVGDRTVDEVITIGRQEIEDEALVKMQNLTTKYSIGVSIDQVQLKNINPPRPVQESFNEVNQAQQEKKFDYVFVDEENFEKFMPASLGQLLNTFREYKS